MSAGSSIVSPSGGFWGMSSGHGSIRSNSSRAGDPPREAKEGYEWVWYPDGYWAERQLERRNSNRETNGSQGTIQGNQMQSAVNKVFRWGVPKASRSPKEQQPQPDHSERLNSVSPMTTTLPSPSQRGFSQFAPPKNMPSSPYMSEEEQTLSLQRPSKNSGEGSGGRDTWTRLNSTTAPLAELILPSSQPPSLPIRTVTSRGAFQNPNESESKEETKGPQNLETTADSSPSYFTQKPIRPPQEDVHFEIKKSDSYDSQRESDLVPKATPAPRGLRKWLRKLPRPRKRVDAASPSLIARPFSRAQDTMSESSSSRSSPVGFSNRPVFTEMPSKSTITSKSTISYPAGEAMHVQTPPLKHLTANGKPRSLFMDIQHPVPLEDESSNSPDVFSATPRIISCRKTQAGEKREWWDAPKTTMRRDPVKDVSLFDFDIPEHLPSSPMCPANPKHKGRGKLVCVYHGRGKQMPPDEDAEEMEDDEISIVV